MNAKTMNGADITRITLPAAPDALKSLKQGELVYINGTMYTARDRAHKRIAEAINSGAPLPFELDGAAIYYCGPTPAPKGRVIGSCGPTTSGRMDAYTPLLIEHGLRVMIGKGVRSAEVKKSILASGGVYFTAIGGAAALYSSCVKACELVAYPDLDCEAVYKLTVEDFPVFVSII